MCWMLLFKDKTNAFSSLFFTWIVGPSGFASGGSSPKPKAFREEGKVTALTGSLQHHSLNKCSVLKQKLSILKLFKCY